MSKDISQYLHYYLGQDCEITAPDRIPYEGMEKINLYWIERVGRHGGKIKPVLRKLESMTEEEVRWYFDSIKRPDDELDNFEWVTEQNGQPVDHPHWIMWCKDQTWARHGYVLGGSEERYEPKQLHYLLSRGFWLFGNDWFDEGYIIDKATLK